MLTMRSLRKSFFIIYPLLAFLCLLKPLAASNSSSFLVATTPLSPAATLFLQFLKEQELTSTKQDLEVFRLYKKRNFEPLWFFFIAPLPAPSQTSNPLGVPHEAAYLRTALSVLFHAENDGLDAADYQEALEAYANFAKARHNQNTTERGLPSWLQVEFLLSKTFLNYIQHVKRGRVPPCRISPLFQLPPPPLDAVAVLESALYAPTLPQASPSPVLSPEEHTYRALTSLAPHHLSYQNLKNLLFALKQEEKKRQDTQQHPSKFTLSRPLKRGQTGEEVAKLSYLLVLYGHLDPSKASPENTPPEAIVFDESVENALKAFQTKNFLEPDGVAGEKTIQRLNQSVKTLMDRVIANMERWRWYPEHPTSKRIVVNVAGYFLKGFQGSHLAFSCKAIVGKPARPTPIFKSDLVSLTVNPAWRVPNTILKNDKLPALSKDPGYARQHGFTILDASGEEVDPYTVDWEENGELYQMEQKPGTFNALGPLRFTLDNVNGKGPNSNKESIYMHGTPQKKLFNNATGSYSSGCVRLEKPFELAEWILSDTPPAAPSSEEVRFVNLTDAPVPPAPSPLSARLKEKVATQKTSVMRVTPIPVDFVYETVWSNPDGSISCSDDPYNLDKATLQALASRKKDEALKSP